MVFSSIENIYKHLTLLQTNLMDNGLADYLNVSNIKQDPIRVSVRYIVKYFGYYYCDTSTLYICLTMLILPGLLSIYDDMKIKRSNSKKNSLSLYSFLKVNISMCFFYPLSVVIIFYLKYYYNIYCYIV